MKMNEETYVLYDNERNYIKNGTLDLKNKGIRDINKIFNINKLYELK